MSFSTKQTSSSAPASFAPLYDAINNAYNQRGILVVASTGNQSASNLFAFPAAWNEVIGVGGSNAEDRDTLNNFAPGNVEIAAPAINVGVTCKGGDQRDEISGTSFATPMVAGALMILREMFPNETVHQIRARMNNGAIPMPSTLKSGSGRLDLVNSSAGPAPSISGPNARNSGESGTWSVVDLQGTPTCQWYINDTYVETGGSCYLTYTFYEYPTTQSLSVGLNGQPASIGPYNVAIHAPDGGPDQRVFGGPRSARNRPRPRP
jgi:subtilisin family serine protease